MLAIRLQRTGRSGHAQFRVIVQDSRFSPARSRVVSYLGSYDPHTKAAKIDGQKAAQYLENGAQPSDSVVKLFQKEGIKLPTWVKISEPKQRAVRKPEKRRSTSPPEIAAPAEPAAEATPAEEATAETPAKNDTPADETAPAEAEPENAPAVETQTKADTTATEPEA